MVKNWSKIVLVSMLVVAIAAPALATTARVRSLANTGNYLSDDSNVFRWYSTLPSYANMVQAEIGTWNEDWFSGFDFGPADSRGLGFNYACGEDGKWGTYRLTLNENAVDHPGFWVVNEFVQGLNITGVDAVTPYNVTPVNKWDLAGGWEIGETMVIGFAYTRSSFSAETTFPTPAEKLSSSWSTYGFGFTWTNNESMILDATFTYASAGGKWEGQATGETWEWDKGTGIEISGRLFYDWKDYVTVVPVVQYGSAEYALQSSPTAFAIPNGDKDMGFLAGVALDLEVNGSNTLIWAAEYVYSKSEPSQPDTVVTTPSGSWKESTMSIFPVFRLALESEITSWLTTRIGAVHANMSFTDTYLNGEDKYTDGAYIPGVGWMSTGFEWFLGAGFNVAEWTIDMELAPETPFSMGWWLHGYSAFDSGDDYGPVARISGTYNF